jgi:molybdenum cofactor cytidylyltransferase
MSAPVVIILAAGRGERFIASGGTQHKLEAPLGAQSVLAHVIEAANTSGLAWHLVRPQGGTPGMGESISLGVAASADASGWLILPADLPLIQPATLRRIAGSLSDKNIVVPHYGRQQGHPVGFSRAWLPRLLALTGDTGAREIVRHARMQANVTDLSLDDSGIVQDIDTLADLERACLVFTSLNKKTCK